MWQHSPFPSPFFYHYLIATPTHKDTVTHNTSNNRTVATSGWEKGGKSRNTSISRHNYNIMQTKTAETSLMLDDIWRHWTSTISASAKMKAYHDHYSYRYWWILFRVGWHRDEWDVKGGIMQRRPEACSCCLNLKQIVAPRRRTGGLSFQIFVTNVSLWLL